MLGIQVGRKVNNRAGRVLSLAHTSAPIARGTPPAAAAAARGPAREDCRHIAPSCKKQGDADPGNVMFVIVLLLIKCQIWIDL